MEPLETFGNSLGNMSAAFSTFKFKDLKIDVAMSFYILYM